jgi:mlo protein
MLLGFISLLLTFGTKYVAKICIPSHLGNIMLPCKKAEAKKEDSTDDRRRLLSFDDENMVWRRSLAAAAGGDDYCSKKVSNIIYINKTYIQFMHLFNHNNSMFL